MHDLTEVGNAYRFVDTWGAVVRFAPLNGVWYTWTGTHWAPDSLNTVMSYARMTVEAIRQEVAQAKSDGYAAMVGRHAVASCTQRAIQAMLTLAEADQRLTISPEQFDCDPWLLNAPNATMDFRTGELREHRPADMLTKILPVPLHFFSPWPTWERFLARVLPDAEIRDFLQAAVGYSLTGSLSEQCLFILFGTGANGKSTFVETIRAALGPYAVNADASILMGSDRANRIGHDLVRLKGARFVSCPETMRDRPLDEPTVKQITGGDRITARELYQKSIEFTMEGKVWLATNCLPTVTGSDWGIWRRLKRIDFGERIEEWERDDSLSEKLLEELPGVLAWAALGALRWMNDGLQFPEAVTRATMEYRTEQDTLDGWLSDVCEIGAGEIGVSEAYRAYEVWAVTHHERKAGLDEFQERLLKVDGVTKPRTKAGMVYRGLALRRQRVLNLEDMYR